MSHSPSESRPPLGRTAGRTAGRSVGLTAGPVRGRRGVGVRGAGVVMVAVLALAGCGGADPGPSAGAGAGGTPSPAAPSVPGGDVVGPPEATEPAAPAPPAPTRPSLADLAEQVAGELSAESVRQDVLGADMSWPQCAPGLGIPQKRSSGQPRPIDAAEYVILGLTNGPGFYPNPCLAEQVSWTRERGKLLGAYAVASYPEPRFLAQYGEDGPFDAATPAGLLANVGYQQARFNIASMRAAGLGAVPVIWIDVEPVPDFEWSADLEANAAVVTGLARGYRDAGYGIGVYSTTALWDAVVGDVALGVPEWRAAGQTSRQEALRRCGPESSIQGGEPILAQWVEDDRDMNLTCPGPIRLSDWFTA